jgi:hypothetical protein
MRAMAIDRRELLGGAGALLLCGSANARARGTGRFAATYADASGGHGVAILDSETSVIRSEPLPARGHDVTVRQGAGEAVVFARRPGRFAVVLDVAGRKPPERIDSEPGRHFFGHGAFSSDGRLLFSTENDIEGGRGVLGIRDATRGYAPIGHFGTGGIGPHDVALLTNGRTLVVANGGIDTDPQGRDPIDVAGMRSTLAYVDARTGDLLEEVDLGAGLRLLSIRHLAVARDDAVVFACQWEGARSEHPPLIGLHRRGEQVRMMAAPAELHRRLKGYAGSIAVDASGEIAAVTSPRGGICLHFDLMSGRCLGSSELTDVCGIAATERAGEFLLTGGEGHVLRASAGLGPVAQSPRPEPGRRWDNHAAGIAL